MLDEEIHLLAQVFFELAGNGAAQSVGDGYRRFDGYVGLLKSIPMKRLLMDAPPPNLRHSRALPRLSVDSLHSTNARISPVW